MPVYRLDWLKEGRFARLSVNADRGCRIFLPEMRPRIITRTEAGEVLARWRRVEMVEPEGFRLTREPIERPPTTEEQAPWT
jgi:hypothetical protein